MKSILIIVDNFSPDLGASSFRFESVVKKLIEKRMKVKVLCSYPNRIDMEGFKELDLENFEVFRINKGIFKNSTLSRAIAYFKFMINSLVVGIKIGKDVDIILASSPQLLVGISGALISIINRKKLILDIRDLWPDIVLDMKVMSRYNPIYLGLKILEKVMYSCASLIVYNSPGFKDYIEMKNKSKKVELITNGIDGYMLDYFKDKQIKPKPKKKYRLMYAGNIGIAQDMVLFTEFVKIYHEEVEIFLFGKGSQEEIIKEKIEKEKIENITIIPSVPRLILLEEYEKADILILQLKNIKMFEKTIPSKIFEYLATGKPIIYGLEGIGKKILEVEFEQKYYYKCNDIKSLCNIYEKLKIDILEEKFKNVNLEKLEKEYSRDNLSLNYANLIEKYINNVK